ncbi:hypothetical protein RUND412_005145 [Rhizina undulata]
MITSTSRSKWMSRKLKSTLHRRDRPIPKPEKPKYYASEGQDGIRHGRESDYVKEMATDQEFNRILDSMKNEDFYATGSLNPSSQQPPPVKSPELQAPAPTSEGANTDAVHTEASDQAPSDLINSSVPEMSSGNFMGPREDVAISGSEEITAELSCAVGFRELPWTRGRSGCGERGFRVWTDKRSPNINNE